MQHEIDAQEEESVDPNRSRLLLRSTPPLRRRLSLMPSAAQAEPTKAAAKTSKRRRKRSYLRVS